jgi:hypothetical protein
MSVTQPTRRLRTGENHSMSVENHAGDPRDSGFSWGLLFSLMAIAAILLVAGRLYIDLYR